MRYRPLLPTLLGLGLTLAACGEAPTQPDTAPAGTGAGPELALASNSWITRRDMPYERWTLSAAVVHNAAGQSILYAIGGQTAGGLSLGRVQAYNVATNTWTWKRDMPVPLYGMNGAAVFNGKIYISGGRTKYDYRTPLAKLYVYDPWRDTWTRKRDMPAGGTSGVSGFINGTLYVLTACVQGPETYYEPCPQSNFYSYNRLMDRWTVLPKPSGAYNVAGVGGVIAGKFYVAGRATPYVGGDEPGRLEVYDPVTNQWTKKAPPPTPPAVGAAGAVLKGRLYVIGGRRYNRDIEEWENVRTTLAYNPITNIWTTKAPLPVRDATKWMGPPTAGAAASAVFPNGQARLELVGGSLPGNNLQYIP